MIMTSLQSFINRRATSRTSVVAAAAAAAPNSRPESPSKPSLATYNNTQNNQNNATKNGGASHIPRVPSRNTNFSRPGSSAPTKGQLRDDSDDFKDSEILSLDGDTRDLRGLQDDDDDDGHVLGEDDDEDDDEVYGSQGEEGDDYQREFAREEVGGRYLREHQNNNQILGGMNGAPQNGGGYKNGSAEVYRWQNAVAAPAPAAPGIVIGGGQGQQDMEYESDGRSTPRILHDDDAATERARTPAGRRNRDRDRDLESEPQEEFYTSLEIGQPFERGGAAATGSNGVSDIKEETEEISIDEPNGGQTWDDIDRQYSQQYKVNVVPVRFSVSGLFDALKELGVPLRGSERLVLQNQLDHYKVYSITNPVTPYQILIPYASHHPLEPTRMKSEIATITYIRRNHPSIPTPEISYHNLDPSNPSKVPFLVIRTLKGRFISDLDGGIPAALKDRRKTATLLDGLAKVQAQIMKPTNNLTIDRIGNLFFRSESKKPKNNFIVGPLLSATEDPEDTSSPPITDLADLCLQVFQAADTFGNTSSSSRVNPKEIRMVKRRLAGLLGLLPPAPAHYAKLTLFHTSLNLSSILVDPATYTITCVLGWRDVYTVPMALTPIYPAEIRPTGSEWNLWVQDSVDAGRGAVDNYWGLRSIYETRLARYDARFAGDLWDDEELGGWLRIWEVVNEGVEGWVRRRRWIEGELGRVQGL